MNESSAKKRKAYRHGVNAEKLALNFLLSQDFILLKSRYKTKYGEIDLIMKREALIAFVEVKARPSLADGLAAITPRACKRIANSALIWMADHADAHHQNSDFRFDVVIVTADHQLTWLEAAFDAQ